jgi:hypothetical protein
MAGTKVREAKPSVVHISRARRAFSTIRPSIEPPLEIPALWTKGVPESDIAIIVDADVRADMDIGDPGMAVLRKINYVLGNAVEAFSDRGAARELVLYMIESLRDFGEPEGKPLLQKAASLFPEDPEVKRNVDQAYDWLGIKKRP